MNLQPNHRALALESGDEPRSDFEQQYKNLLNEEIADSALVYANDIYENAYKQEVLEAFILSRATSDEIENILNVPTNVIEIYKILFFDIEIFKDELDIEAYAQTYVDTLDGFGKKLKVAAITLGKEYLFYRFCRGTNGVDMEAALKNLIETSYMLAQATKLNPLDSNASREARQWAKLTASLIESYKKISDDSGASSDEFILILKQIDVETRRRPASVETEEISGDDLLS